MLSENAKKVLEKRIAGGDESWEDVCYRVAQKVASCEVDEKKYIDEFYKIIYNLDFLPNSPALRNFGRNDGSASACFVLPIEDSRRSIFGTLSDAVDVQSMGGGTGFNFSKLRPNGDIINSTNGIASGPISFMSVYDFVIGEIIAQGGTRKGANMGILNASHPEIMRFIKCKAEEGKLKNFNISVGVTNEFIKAVINKEEWKLQFNGTVYETLPAIDIWDTLIEHSHKNGEPSLIFLDTINDNASLREYGEIVATNPCGEQALHAYGSCILGSINLANHTLNDDNKCWTEESVYIDWEKLCKTVRIAVRFLDNVITVNNYPIKKIEDVTKYLRQIGLGIMGFADLLLKMHIRYGSEKSIVVAKDIINYIYNVADKESKRIGAEKGHAPFYNRHSTQLPNAPKGSINGKRRNGALTCIAPTGTLSLLANCSSGCEPHFDFNYTKECMGGTKLNMLPKLVQMYMDKKGIGIEELPNFFVTTKDVTLKEHIDIQAAFQNNGIDSAVSKTINAPYETTKEQLSEAFLYAHKKGCKGITFYRDGSRKEQVLYTDKKDKKIEALYEAREELKKHDDAVREMSKRVEKFTKQMSIKKSLKRASDLVKNWPEWKKAGLAGYNKKDNTILGMEIKTDPTLNNDEMKLTNKEEILTEVMNKMSEDEIDVLFETNRIINEENNITVDTSSNDIKISYPVEENSYIELMMNKENISKYNDRYEEGDSYIYDIIAGPVEFEDAPHLGLPSKYIERYDDVPLKGTYKEDSIDRPNMTQVNTCNECFLQTEDEDKYCPVRGSCTDSSEFVSKERKKLDRGELHVRPKTTIGIATKLKTACGKLYISNGFDGNDVIETFVFSEGGGCLANTKAMGILASYCLQLGLPPEKLIQRLRQIECPACKSATLKGRDIEVRSCADGIGKALEYAYWQSEVFDGVSEVLDSSDEFFKGKNSKKVDETPVVKGEIKLVIPEPDKTFVANDRNVTTIKDTPICPDCSYILRYSEGCVICQKCGYSKC